MSPAPEDELVPIRRTDLVSVDRTEIRKKTEGIFAKVARSLAEHFRCNEDSAEKIGSEAGGLLDAWWKSKILKNVAEVEKTFVEVEKGRAEIAEAYRKEATEAASVRKMLSEAALSDSVSKKSDAEARRIEAETDEFIRSNAERLLEPLLREYRATYGFAAVAVVGRKLTILVGNELRSLPLPVDALEAAGGEGSAQSVD